MECIDVISPSCPSTTLLIEAVKTNYDEIIRLVLNHPKMDKTVINKFAKQTGRNALHQVCYSFNSSLYTSQRLSKNTIKLMIDKDININAPTKYVRIDGYLDRRYRDANKEVLLIATKQTW